MRSLLSAFLAVSLVASPVLGDQLTVPGVAANGQGQLPSMNGGVAPSTTWVSTATQAITTAAETSCFPSTGIGTRTIPANVPYVGNSFRLHCAGTVTTPIAGGTITLKLKWGSVAVATLSSLILLTSLTAAPFVIDAYCTVRTVSATPSSSTMVCDGSLQGGIAAPIQFISASPISVDTTTNQVIDLTWTWASVAGSQASSVIHGNVEILY
jgi:hypothetical protein